MLKLYNRKGICIDKEGVWYFRGAEMKRQDIVQYFYRYLKKDDDGNYLIEIEKDRCYVEVEDAPYVIKRVSVSISEDDARPYIELSLCDGSKERLNLNSPLRMGDDNVLYCRVKNGEYEARFSRPAYYQFSEYIEYDSRIEKYVLSLNQQSYPLFLTDGTNGEMRPASREIDKPK